MNLENIKSEVFNHIKDTIASIWTKVHANDLTCEYGYAIHPFTFNLKGDHAGSEVQEILLLPSIEKTTELFTRHETNGYMKTATWEQKS